MFKHYLTTALRHFVRNRLTAAINVTCLVIGLASFLVIFGIVGYFDASDRTQPHAKRIYAITERMEFAGTDFRIPMLPHTGGIVAKYLKTDFPTLTVARATFALNNETTPLAFGDKKLLARASFVDPAFFDIFALPLLAGDAKTALREPRSAIVSEDTALRLFGTLGQAIGKRIYLQSNEEVQITGVLGALPQPSHMGMSETKSLRFDMLVSMDVYESLARTNPVAQRQLQRWQASQFFTYAMLPADGSLTAASFRAQLKLFGARHTAKDSGTIEFDAIPIGDLSLTRMNAVFGTDKTGISASALLQILGVVVLLISCLNYANLATAQAMTRAKEVGMRRIVGANRMQVTLQYLIEAGLMTAISLAIAAVAALLILHALPLRGMSTVIAAQASSLGLWSVLVGMFAAVTITAGAYPAFVLSRVQPIHAVRTGRMRLGSRFVSTLLVGAQFGAASFLLIAILVMSAQNRAMRQAALRAETNPVVVIANGTKANGVDFELLRTELMRQPHIESVAGTVFAPWEISSCSQEFVTTTADRNAPRRTVCGNSVTVDFFKTFDQKLLAGRTFDTNHADVYGVGPFSSVVIDSALAQQNGWATPQDAVGETIYYLDWNDTQKPPYPLRVIGVVETRPISPVGFGATSNTYVLQNESAAIASIRISKSDVPAALREIEAVWTALAPRVALKWRFTDELMNQTYTIFNLIGGVFGSVALFAFVIAILGLIGMSLHVIGRRTHEIGVRKTLGASVRQVVALLLRDFSRPVLIANVIAWPLAFAAMQIYLSIFTERVALNVVPFILSLALTLAIAWLSVAAQATRAARMKPATVLRHE